MRLLPWCAGFALAAIGLGVSIEHALDGAPSVSLEITPLSELAPRLVSLARRAPSSRDVRIAFFGDSTSMHHGHPPLGIEARLEAALVSQLSTRVRPRVFSFAFHGATPFTYYFLAPRVAATRPDRVVLGLNLHVFAAMTRQNDRPRLAAWLPLRHIGEALRLPLYWIGLDASELLLYPSLVRAGVLRPWLRVSRLQARAAEHWRAAESALDERAYGADFFDTRELHFLARHGANFLPGTTPLRETAELVRFRLGAALAGVTPEHPELEMLGATLDIYAAYGIETLVYVVPVNIQHHEKLGAYRREELLPTLDAVRGVVEARGASLLDLATLLPDAAFGDGSGHLAVGDPIDAPPLVIEPLVRALLRSELRASR